MQKFKVKVADIFVCTMLIGLLVYWFICMIKQDILQITILYHVGSPVDEPPWVTAAVMIDYDVISEQTLCIDGGE